MACMIAGQYGESDEMDFEGQEWLILENAEPKPDKVCMFRV
jgi:hypothetical protein